MAWPEKHTLSSKRLRDVQSLLQGESDEDAILAILGIDSRYNEGCRKLANFLFFDFYDVRLPDLEQCGIPEDDLDDVFLLIRKSSVAVYCSAVLYHYLLPYIAHWQNLQVYCLIKEIQDDANDTDEAEQFKINSFASIVRGCKKIGIPYYVSRSYRQRSPEQGAFSKFAIEKWPIIQAYASEDFGSGEFFTMCYEVTNIQERLQRFFDQCDPASLEGMLFRSLPLFERHWRELMNTIGGISGDAEKREYVAFPEVTEAQVAEPIKSYFCHGRLSDHSILASANGDAQVQKNMPFVQFGVNTSKMFKGVSSEFATLANSGEDENAMHMIVHSSAPTTPISCTRTYFVKPGGKSGQSNIYSLCVESANKAMQTFKETLNVKAATDAAKHHMRKVTNELPDANTIVAIRLEAVNNSGKLLSMDLSKPLSNIKKVEVSVSDIRSISCGKYLGNVSYCDTFIESTIMTADNESLKMESGNKASCLAAGPCTELLVLSGGVPKFAEWQVQRVESPRESDILTTLENVLLAESDRSDEISKQNNIVVLKDSSLLVCPMHAIPYPVTTDQIEKVTFYQSPKSLEVAVVDIHMKSAAVNSNLAIFLYPNSTPLKLFNNKVKPLFENSPLDFETVDELESWTKPRHESTQKLYEWHLRSGGLFKSDSWSDKINRAAVSLQPQLGNFLAHFEISSALGSSPVPPGDIAFLLNTESQDQPEVNFDNKVCISVLIGLPGSHVDRLSSSLVSLNKEKVRWVTVRTSNFENDAANLDVTHLHKALADAVTKRRTARPGAAATKRLRIIVEALGCFDVATVVSSILNHPNPSTRSAMYIGSVTACVEPLASVLHHKLYLPNMAEQCRAGLVNCIAFTGKMDDLKDKDLAEMKTYLRLVNSDAAFLLASEGKTSRTGDFDLILSESAFNTPDCTKTRHLSVPGIWNSSFDFGQPFIRFDVVKLEFSQPLLRATLSARLRTLRHALGPAPYHGNIYVVKGTVSFTDCLDTENDVTFVTNTGKLTIDPRHSNSQSMVPAPPPSKGSRNVKHYFISFYGVGLKENSLKDWLKKCGRQRATKKCPKTRSNLSNAELKAIQERHSTDPLPEGVFFNGTQYCSLFDNGRSYQHPNIQKFIDEYLEQENQKIYEFNLKVEQESVGDMF